MQEQFFFYRQYWTFAQLMRQTATVMSAIATRRVMKLPVQELVPHLTSIYCDPVLGNNGLDLPQTGDGQI
jgi:hypothetical protein